MQITSLLVEVATVNIYSLAEAGAEYFEKDYSFEREFRRGWSRHVN